MSLAIYLNCTQPLGANAPSIKARIRKRIKDAGGTITRIHRNEFSAEAHRYRFLRVHFTTKD